MSEERAGFVGPVPQTDRETLGDRLRIAREYVGLKQEEVARHLSIPRSALSNIEAGTRKVDGARGHPEIRGVANRRRIKQTYRMSKQPLAPLTFPPRWKLDCEVIPAQFNEMPMFHQPSLL